MPPRRRRSRPASARWIASASPALIAASVPRQASLELRRGSRRRAPPSLASLCLAGGFTAFTARDLLAHERQQLAEPPLERGRVRRRGERVDLLLPRLAGRVDLLRPAALVGRAAPGGSLSVVARRVVVAPAASRGGRSAAASSSRHRSSRCRRRATSAGRQHAAERISRNRDTGPAGEVGGRVRRGSASCCPCSFVKTIAVSRKPEVPAVAVVVAPSPCDIACRNAITPGATRPRRDPVAVGGRAEVVAVVAAAPVEQAVADVRPVVADVRLHRVLIPAAVVVVLVAEVVVAVRVVDAVVRQLLRGRRREPAVGPAPATWNHVSGSLVGKRPGTSATCAAGRRCSRRRSRPRRGRSRGRPSRRRRGRARAGSATRSSWRCVAREVVAEEDAGRRRRCRSRGPRPGRCGSSRCRRRRAPRRGRCRPCAQRLVERVQRHLALEHARSG